MGYGSGVAISCGVGRRRGSDPGWLWLWCGPAAEALTGPLAWEPPYATSVALKKEKKKKKKSPPRTGLQTSKPRFLFFLQFTHTLLFNIGNHNKLSKTQIVQIKNHN